MSKRFFTVQDIGFYAGRQVDHVYRNGRPIYLYAKLLQSYFNQEDLVFGGFEIIYPVEKNGETGFFVENFGYNYTNANERLQELKT